MTALFDEPPQGGDRREVGGRMCQWHDAEPDDPFGGEWVPVEPASGSTSHKPATGADDTYKLIKARKGEFQRRTIEIYRAKGWHVYKVETSTSFWAGGSTQVVTKDLWGLFDLEAFSGLETVGIQFTSRSNLGQHLTKMCDHRPVGANDRTTHAAYLRRWLEAGRLVHLVGWAKEGARWAHEVREVTLDVMDNYEPGRRFKKMGKAS